MKWLKNLKPSPLSPEQFWEWFSKNSIEVMAIRTGQEPIIQKLSAQLNRYHSGVTWEIGPGEFILSADGSKANIAPVKRLVAAAPKFDGIEVIAFRQGKPGFALRMGDHQLDEESVRFVGRRNGSVFDLVLFVDGLTTANTDQIGNAIMILLDSTVGEYNVMTKIGMIDLQPLPLAPQGHRPLADLEAELKKI